MDYLTPNLLRVLFASALPAQGASGSANVRSHIYFFASALPAQGASVRQFRQKCTFTTLPRRCLHRVHPQSTDSKIRDRTLPRRCLHRVHLHIVACKIAIKSLPRRCLHRVHRQTPTNCGTPFCSIRRESVDSFSEINNKDSCADYFPALFCCQGDLHHHYRQPRTGNRPVLRCEQHRLFLFILSSHYRRLL